MTKKALIVGGANGIGLSVATVLAESSECECVYIVDKADVPERYRNEKFECHRFDLTTEDFSIFDRFADIDTLFITAGFGRLSLFRDIEERMISDSFNVNVIPMMRIIKRFYPKLECKEDFRCGVMGSIAGFMSSPFFAVYGATKAAIKIFVESVNVELKKAGSTNRILNVSPGSIKGTCFNNGETDLSLTRQLAEDIVKHMEAHSDLYIPQYEEVFRNVLNRYHEDFRKEGEHSYEYKANSERMRLLIRD